MAACRHENIGTTLVIEDGGVTSTVTQCDDCGQRLT